MYKYGVRLLKNRLYPVKMPKNCEEELQHGQMVLITTEKGQEVAKILRISQCVFQKWGGFGGKFQIFGQFRTEKSYSLQKRVPCLAD